MPFIKDEPPRTRLSWENIGSLCQRSGFGNQDNYFENGVRVILYNST